MTSLRDDARLVLAPVLAVAGRLGPLEASVVETALGELDKLLADEEQEAEGVTNMLLDTLTECDELRFIVDELARGQAGRGEGEETTTKPHPSPATGISTLPAG